MAAQRYISTSFWDDAWIQNLDPGEKLIYMYLLTNALTNIAGIYEITKRRISFDTGYPMDMVSKALNRLEKDKKAYHFNDAWIILVNWPKHQKAGARSKIRDGIDAVLKALPDEVWSYLCTVDYQYDFLKEIDREIYPIDTLSIPYGYTSNYIDFESDIDIDIDLNTSCPNSGESDAPPNVLEEEIKIAEQMAQIIKEFTPTAKVPTSFVKWAEVIDRTIRIDGRTPEQVLWLFRWSQNHDFWNRNIRSPDKLRKHWDSLVLEAKAEQKPKKQTNQLSDRLSGTMAALKTLEEEIE